MSDVKKPLTESVGAIKKKLDKLAKEVINEQRFPVSLQALLDREVEDIARGYALACLGLKKSFHEWEFVASWQLNAEQKGFREAVTKRINAEITKLLSNLEVPVTPQQMRELQSEFNCAYKEAYKARLAEALQQLAEEEAQKVVDKALNELRVQLAEEQE